MRRITKAAAGIGAAGLLITTSACAGSGDKDAADKDCVDKTDQKVAMAFDVGGRGDQSFNDLSAKGLDAAECELGFEVQTAEAQKDEPESAREERLQQLVDAGFGTIIAVGFIYDQSLVKVAKANPKVNFAVVDSRAKGDNIANLLFAENEGSYLVGAAAALKTKSDNIGFVGGVETPTIKKFEVGYVAGAKAVNPKIKIQTRYLTQAPDFSGFDDPPKAESAAAGMYDGGADIVYHVSGGSGSGVFDAALDAGGKAIGVDSDQALTADKDVRDVILTSMLKNVDVSVRDYLETVSKGEALSGLQEFDLQDGGVGYATTGGQIDDITDKLDDYKSKIIDGEIKVPTK